MHLEQQELCELTVITDGQVRPSYFLRLPTQRVKKKKQKSYRNTCRLVKTVEIVSFTGWWTTILLITTILDSRMHQVHRKVDNNPSSLDIRGLDYNPSPLQSQDSRNIRFTEEWITILLQSLDRIMYYIPRQDVQGSKKVNYNP